MHQLSKVVGFNLEFRLRPCLSSKIKHKNTEVFCPLKKIFGSDFLFFIKAKKVREKQSRADVPLRCFGFL